MGTSFVRAHDLLILFLPSERDGHRPSFNQAFAKKGTLDFQGQAVNENTIRIMFLTPIPELNSEMLFNCAESALQMIIGLSFARMDSRHLNLKHVWLDQMNLHPHARVRKCQYQTKLSPFKHYTPVDPSLFSDRLYSSVSKHPPLRFWEPCFHTLGSDDHECMFPQRHCPGFPNVRYLAWMGCGSVRTSFGNRRRQGAHDRVLSGTATYSHDNKLKIEKLHMCVWEQVKKHSMICDHRCECSTCAIFATSVGSCQVLKSKHNFHYAQLLWRSKHQHQRYQVWIWESHRTEPCFQLWFIMWRDSINLFFTNLLLCNNHVPDM